MVNGMYVCMMLSGLVFALLQGNGQVLGSELLLSARRALDTVWNMAGALMFFCGVTEILRESGWMGTWTKWLKKPLGRLLGQAPDEALSDMCMNLLCNMLGMGSAATPFGISAMQKMACGSSTSNAMCLFLVINTSSVQLMPTTLIALRAAAGSANPESIVLPSLLATLASTLGGIIACKLLEKKA